MDRRDQFKHKSDNLDTIKSKRRQDDIGNMVFSIGFNHLIVALSCVRTRGDAFVLWTFRTEKFQFS